MNPPDLSRCPIEMLMMTLPGVLGLIWLIQIGLRRPTGIGGWLLASLVAQGLCAVLWILVAIVAWTHQGGHPPLAVLVFLGGVLASVVLFPIAIVLALISWGRASKTNSLHIETLVFGSLALGVMAWARLFLR